LPDRVFDLTKQAYLGRVVADDLLQIADKCQKLFVTGSIRCQEIFFTSQKITAHTSFHINGRGLDLHGFPDHFVGAVDPFTGITQYQNVIRLFSHCQAFIKQFLFTVTESGYLIAELVEVDLAAPLAHQIGHVIHVLGITDLPAQLDGGFGDVVLPPGNCCGNLIQKLHLSRIVTHRRLKFTGQLIKSLSAGNIWIKEIFLTGQQISPHSGFHVNG